MKYFLSMMMTLCIFLLASKTVYCENEYKGDQIILSWTGDNAHVQTINWHTNTGKPGYVQFNEENRKLSEKKQIRAKVIKVRKNGQTYYKYEGRIRGLHQNTKYDYRVGDGKKWSKKRSFVTAPAKKDTLLEQSDQVLPFEFLYLGDVQYMNRNKDYKSWGRFVKKAQKRHPEIAFGITGGDMVNYAGNIREWGLFFKNAEPVFSNIPLMTTAGNHEIGHNTGVYTDMVAMPQNGPSKGKESFYSFDYSNCHFTILDTTFFMKDIRKKFGLDWETQKQEINHWLEADLNSTDAKWKIVVMHHPPYGISDGEPIYHEIRENWEAKLQEGKVDLVLCGHQHIYMRTKDINGITYVMGNSGEKRSRYYNGENFPDYGDALDATNSNYQIIRIEPRKITMTSYEEEGQIIDKWSKKDSYFIGNKTAVVVIVVMIVLAGLMLARIFLWRRDT